MKIPECLLEKLLNLTINYYSIFDNYLRISKQKTQKYKSFVTTVERCGTQLYA